MTTAPAASARSHAGLVARLGDTIATVLDPLIPADGRVALVDFPQTPNVGDNLIWLGELAYLARRGDGAPHYTCTDLTYDPDRLARRIGRGTILLSGGGNFGDLYPVHQRLRERVIADFPGHRIIQLPQSIHFGDDASARRARAVLDAHPDLTLLVRDRSSLEIARAHFRAPSRLCPDMCLCLGPLARTVAPDVDVVWLSRDDKESASRSRIEVPGHVRRVDWIQDEPRFLIRASRFLARQIRLRPAMRPLLAPPLEPAYGTIARLRLERGCRTLGAGRVVVTDRLHGHLLSLLLGIPHIILDNSYGKVHGFHEAWTRDSDLVRSCEDESEALRLAGEMARA